MDYTQLSKEELNQLIAERRGHKTTRINGILMMQIGKGEFMSVRDWAGNDSTAFDLFTPIPTEFRPVQDDQGYLLCGCAPRAVAEAWLRWQDSLPEPEQYLSRTKRLRRQP